MNERVAEDGGEAIVELDNVIKTYRVGAVDIPAIQGVSLKIAPERFTMLVAPSGSGKTTLLNLIGCLDKPSSGRVRIAGTDVNALGDDARSDFRAEKIGFIFQSFSLIPVLSAYENVEYPLLLTKVSTGERRRRTGAMLEAVGLTAQRAQRPNQLSGGQKQRVAIARALVQDPAIVLADEPTANLDSQTGANIVALMRRMQAQSKTTFIFATHDAELMSHADRIVSLLDGRVVAANQDHMP